MKRLRKTITDKFTRIRNARWARKHVDIIVASALLIIGVTYYSLAGFSSFLECLKQFLVDMHSELIGIGITVLIINSVTRYSQKQKEMARKAIERMKSQNKEISRGAVRELTEKGWLYDGMTSGSSLQHAYLAGADLSYANLSSADIKNGDLSDTSLRETNLRDADLRGADLSRAVLEGADLTGVKYDKSTRWPKGFDPDAAGAVLVEEH